MDNSKKGRIRTVLAALAAFMALGMLGTGDYETALETQEVYVDMVCKGLWPDYQNQKPNCQDESYQLSR